MGTRYEIRCEGEARGIERVGRIGDASLLLVLPQLGEAGVQVVLERIDRSLGVIPSSEETEAIDLEAVFTVLLSPEQAMEPEVLLDALTEAREQAALGSPVITRVGA